MKYEELKKLKGSVALVEVSVDVDVDWDDDEYIQLECRASGDCIEVYENSQVILDSVFPLAPSELKRRKLEAIADLEIQLANMKEGL